MSNPTTSAQFADRILKHYITSAMLTAGATITSDTDAELSELISPIVAGLIELLDAQEQQLMKLQARVNRLEKNDDQHRFRIQQLEHQLHRDEQRRYRMQILEDQVARLTDRIDHMNTS